MVDSRPTTTSVEEADLPPFSNQSGEYSRCAGRGPIRVHFDRDCARAATTTIGFAHAGIGGSSAADPEHTEYT